MIRGWRLYALGANGELFGVRGHRYDETSIAACTLTERHRHEFAPHHECACGYHMVARREDLNAVFGWEARDWDSILVEMLHLCHCAGCTSVRLSRNQVAVVEAAVVGWGRTVPHERGWRVERVRVESLGQMYVPSMIHEYDAFIKLPGTTPETAYERAARLLRVSSSHARRQVFLKVRGRG